MSIGKKELIYWSATDIPEIITVRPPSADSLGSLEEEVLWEDSRSRAGSPTDTGPIDTGIAPFKPTFFKEEMRLDKTPPEEDSEPESDGRFYSMIGSNVSRPDKLFKVIIIGDPTVGKTSFVQRYVQNTYRRDYKGTVGVDFALKILKWSETQTAKLQLWDIAGQERFTWMTRVYYKDAHGCVIMFDLTNKNSFMNSLKWKRDVDSKCSLPDGRPIPCILLANKCDLSHRQVDLFEVESFQKEHNFIGWTEISAKEGLMVNDSMRFLVDVMMRNADHTGEAASTDDSLKLSNQPDQTKKCSC